MAAEKRFSCAHRIENLVGFNPNPCKCSTDMIMPANSNGSPLEQAGQRGSTCGYFPAWLTAEDCRRKQVSIESEGRQPFTIPGLGIDPEGVGASSQRVISEHLS